MEAERPKSNSDSAEAGTELNCHPRRGCLSEPGALIPAFAARRRRRFRYAWLLALAKIPHVAFLTNQAALSGSVVQDTVPR